MILIAAIDNHGGMLFHDRRQSRDRILCARILELSAGKRLWIHPYSAGLFVTGSNAAQIQIDASFLEKAAPGDYCLIENVSASPYQEAVEKIILFKWNRSYPADFYFDIPVNDGGWTLSFTEDFAGSSHENITVEIYERIAP